METGDGEERRWKRERGGRYFYRSSPAREGAWDHALVGAVANQRARRYALEAVLTDPAPIH
jgi:hypothetical protein